MPKTTRYGGASVEDDITATESVEEAPKSADKGVEDAPAPRRRGRPRKSAQAPGQG